MFKKFLIIYLITFILVILFFLGYKLYKDNKPVDDTFLEKYYKYTPETRFFRVGQKPKLKNIQGEIHLQSVDGSERIITTQTEVEEGDLILAEGNSSAEIEFKTGIVKFSDDAEIKLKRIDENSVFNEQHIEMFLNSGELIATVVREEDRTLNFSVRTNNLIVGARGTKFGVSVKDNATRVNCYEGMLKLTDNMNNEVFLRRGFEVNVQQNQPLPQPQKFNLIAHTVINNWFNEKRRDENRLRSQKSNFQILREQLGQTREQTSDSPIPNYRAMTESGRKMIENYLKNVYKKLYGRDWEKRFNADKERLLNEYRDYQIEFFNQDPFARSVVDDLKSKYSIDESKTVDDYIKE
jgi:hypothetical protein